MPRSRLRPLARIGGWIGCLSAYGLLRWVWTADVSAHASMEVWYRSTMAACALSGVSAATGLALLATSAVEFGPDFGRRSRAWTCLFWTGVGLLPGYFVGQILLRTVSRAQLELVVLPPAMGDPVPVEPTPWFARIPTPFVVQVGTAAAVAGFVLVILARWRLVEARRGIAVEERDSGRWE